ncbi:hypothetical protein [Sphingomonas sp. PP-CE-1G-424]|uniref:hypothetical protein n=1 Tax=Sphingomonas sp. PP-CE-1G-424 TaxID=2135658 RepID=UPI00105662F9|nr:hypothetical protein [Sphingomonas sp. PP-CE-1G-424]TCP65359.1 hypothetical protein C8J43_11215 [Sphingomonas sp. PP-CE-1G-424]
MFTIEWRPAAAHGDDLMISVAVTARENVRLFASRQPASTMFRIRAPHGRQVTVTRQAVLDWATGTNLPVGDTEWPLVPISRGDGIHAIEMLDAFLAWTRSRGLIDEATSRRISGFVQMELSGATRGTPE